MPNDPFIYSTDPWKLVLGLFILMLGFIYTGRKVGLKRSPSQSEGEASSTGTIVSAMFGLLAFILAFEFSMSSSRFDTRRGHIVDEANAIGTAILRADIYPDEYRAAFRKDLQQYLEARIQYYEAHRHFDQVLKAMSLANEAGKRLWDRAARLSHNLELRVASAQMIPALNTMLDINTTRLTGELSRVPVSILWMLFILSLSCAFYLGYASAGKGSLDWFVASGFCLLTSVVIFISLDLDRSRRGLIQMSTPQKAMLELRELF